MSENERLNQNSLEVGVTINGKRLFVRGKLPEVFFDSEGVMSLRSALLPDFEALAVDLCRLIATRGTGTPPTVTVTGSGMCKELTWGDLFGGK